MKLLVALPRFPYPLDKGDKLRAYHQLKYLSKNNEVHLVCLSEEKVSAKNLAHIQSLCSSVKVFQLSKIGRTFRVLRAAFQNIPYQVAYFYSFDAKQYIEQLILSKGIEVCYFQLIRMIPNIPFGVGNCKYFLDYMDAFSTNMRRRLPYYNGLKRVVFADEADRVEKYEKRALKLIDEGSFISRNDATVIVSKKIQCIANGVDRSFFEQGYADRNYEYDLIFTGNMSYHPNVQAAVYLVKKILPLLKKRGLNLKVCLVGTQPNALVKSLSSNSVTVTGFVPDIKDYLRKSRLFIAPLFSGSGLQNKLLESMAMSLPTISTSLANQPLQANVHQMQVADDASEFAEKIELLLNDAQQAAELSSGGQQFVAKEYDWTSFNSYLEGRLRNLAGQ